MDLLNSTANEVQQGARAPETSLLSNPLSIFAVAALLAHAIFQYIYYCNVKGPRVWPYFGSVHGLFLNGHRVYDWIATLLLQYRGTYTFVVPIVPSLTSIVTCDPDCLEYILKTRFCNYPKGSKFSYVFHQLLGDGIFNTDGDPWKTQRKTASLEFSTKALRELMVSSVRTGVQERLLPVLDGACHQETTIDLQDVFLRYTFDNICIVAFGVDPGCLAPGLPYVPFATSFDVVTEATCKRLLTPEWLWRFKRALGIGIEGKLKTALVVVDNFAKDVIATRRRQLQLVQPGEDAIDVAKFPSLLSRRSGIDSQFHLHDLVRADTPAKLNTRGNSMPAHPSSSFADLLSRFMQTKDCEGKPYSDSFLRDVATNFIIAGRDTSAVALTWFFWLLSKNPEVEKKILEELAGVLRSRTEEAEDAKPATLGGLASEPFTFDELRRMQYLHAALSESLRLYPSVPLDTKYAAEDDVLPDGTKVPKGGRVVYAMYAMGRMPFIWGHDCLDFKPERWLRNGVFTAENHFKFTAFNAGPRLCLGKDLGYLQMKAVSSAVLWNYKVDIDPRHPIDYRVSLTLFMKHGLMVRLQRRSPEDLERLLEKKMCRTGP